MRPVKGALAIALSARKHKIKGLILPTANAAEAAVVEGLDVFPVKHLREAAEFLAGTALIKPLSDRPEHDPRRVRRDRARLCRREGPGARQARHRGCRGRRPQCADDRAARQREVDAGETDSGHLPAALARRGAGDDEGPQRRGATRARSRDGDAPAISLAASHRFPTLGWIGGTAVPSPGEVSLAHHGVAVSGRAARVSPQRARGLAPAAGGRHGHDLAGLGLDDVSLAV